MIGIKCATNCGVCTSSSLLDVWDLPSLPLTEKFGDYDQKKKLSYDQVLTICGKCGHVQLKNQLDPIELYKPSEYAFRSGNSEKGKIGNNIFLEFLLKNTSKRIFKSCLDIGGNDLELMRLLTPYAHSKYVVDPVCVDINFDGIHILPKFIEDIDLKKDIEQPDLIVCRHVLEHISQPNVLIQTLLDQSCEDALFVFEVPSFACLMDSYRFDAIFHQHYHYFDIQSFETLITRCGGECLDFMHYHQGSNGCSLLIAFRKAKKIKIIKSEVVNKKKEAILEKITDFRYTMNITSKKLNEFDSQIYGYGASLMLATLGYHLKTDFSQLVCILDDDCNKNGMGYQNMNVKVKSPRKMEVQFDQNFIITSLENARIIYKRILEFKPKRIITPIIS
jgi:hypothetical protein